MKTVIVTADQITAKTAMELAAKLGMSTVNAKGVERTASEQAKYMKRLAQKQELSYSVADSKRAEYMDLRKGKVTKSAIAREMILAGKGMSKTDMIKKLQKELNFKYQLAYMYYTKNRKLLVDSGQLEVTA